jgi:ribonucleoside-diphosphate reductase beta chain
MYRKASEEEQEWADYLFRDGSIIGLNAVLLKTYNKHITNKRLQAIGYKTIYEHTDNPLSWMDNWLNSSNVEVAPQETELTSYVIGGLDSNTTEEDWAL